MPKWEIGELIIKVPVNLVPTRGSYTIPQRQVDENSGNREQVWVPVSFAKIIDYFWGVGGKQSTFWVI